jgi:hypothetical protein
MTAGERAIEVAAAALAAAIERAAIDLALAEEPARFLAVLEAAPADPPAASCADCD